MKKTLIAVVLTLVVCLCAFGTTLALLADKTESVVNTFTVGDVDITLTETTGDEYKMIPGSTIEKDPTVAVLADSEECWLFVEIKESDNLDAFIAYEVADGWTELAGNAGVYYRTAKAGDSFSVLADDQVTVKETVTKAQMDAITDVTKPTLTFTAYAVQAENVNDVNTAWTHAQTAAVTPNP